MLPRPPRRRPAAKIALFDPKGETAQAARRRWASQCQPVEADADLAGYDVLIVGKAALTRRRPGPGHRPRPRRAEGGRLRADLRGAGEAVRASASPSTACGRSSSACRTIRCWPGSTPENLRDWRGEATILPPRLKYTTSQHLRRADGQVVRHRVPRVWRCGNRGNVASVLIEKPARGDFLPILDGGFSLQYSPLMEYREGKGLVLFCQMDVTGRTEQDPAAETLARNILQYVAAWKPAAAPAGALRRRPGRQAASGVRGHRRASRTRAGSSRPTRS